MKPAAIALALALMAWSEPAKSDEHCASVTPLHVLKTLHAGNQRYVTHRLNHPNQTMVLRQELISGQHPVAAVLSCADSRVPPELVFDQGLGDLFTVRVAGNIVDDAILGSLEYAAEHLHVPMIIVLGHTGCGAVKATLDGGEPNTHIESLVQAIRPAVADASHDGAASVDSVVTANVRRTVKQIQESNPILALIVKQGKIQVRGAVYHMTNGMVEFLKD